jgi:putative ABC transport system ATP-binding protein
VSDLVCEFRKVTAVIGRGRERRNVLIDASLSLERSKLYLLQGPSGSGKSTTLAMAAGLLMPDAGEVWVQGECLSRMRESFRAELRRKRIGLMVQSASFWEDLTVAENLFLGFVSGTVPAGVAMQAETLLERFAIASLLGARVRVLSSGERQRLALIRALLGNPPLLLLDEPTASLDEKMAAEVVACIAHAVEEGATAFVATHDNPTNFPGATLARLVDASFRVL